MNLLLLFMLAAAPAAEPYADAYFKARRDGGWLITYVGCPVSIRLDGALTAYCDSLEGFEAGVVVISGPHDGKHVWYRTLRNPSDSELKAVFKACSSPPEVRKAVSLPARTFPVQNCST